MEPSKLAIYVEADPSHVELVAAILERRGYRIEAAAGCERALELVHERRPDVALIDLSIPEGGGLALIRALRAARASADLPIVALSASNLRGEARQAVAAGADAFLAKPFPIDALVTAIAAAADARRPRPS